MIILDKQRCVENKNLGKKKKKKKEKESDLSLLSKHLVRTVWDRTALTE